MIWKTLLSYVILSISALAGIAGYILWTRQHHNRQSNRLLASLFFICAYINFVTSLIINGSIFFAPHLFRTAAPLNYLAGPLGYLYVRTSLFSSKRLDYRYLWLGLPALLSYIELIPFYLQSADAKIARLHQLEQSADSLFYLTEGWLPPSTHLLLFTAMNLIFTLLAGRLLWTFRAEEKAHFGVNTVYREWLNTFVIISLIGYGALLIGVPFYGGTSSANLSIVMISVISEGVFCYYVIRRPLVLYGVYRLETDEFVNPDYQQPTPQIMRQEIVVPQDTVVTHLLSPIGLESVRTAELQEIREPKRVPHQVDVVTDIQEKLDHLEQYMSSQKPYLQPRLSLANVSVAIDIPPYLLSAMLNQVMGLDFRDYVNAYRVRYLCDLFQSKQYPHLTLEGISEEAGFSSKSTFYRAFHKYTGLTPTQYINLYSPPGSH
ncbi:hypothetical protein GCM10028805_46230 [Spirosoma harenae]